MVGATVGDEAEHVAPRGSQRSASPGARSTASNDTKGKGKGNASSIVGKWDVCTLAKGKVRALRPNDAHFPTILVSQCMSLRAKAKENAKDLIRLVLPRPLGGVGETPHEDATPPEVVRLLADQAGGDQ